MMGPFLSEGAFFRPECIERLESDELISSDRIALPLKSSIFRCMSTFLPDLARSLQCQSNIA